MDGPARWRGHTGCLVHCDRDENICTDYCRSRDRGRSPGGRRGSANRSMLPVLHPKDAQALDSMPSRSRKGFRPSYCWRSISVSCRKTSGPMPQNASSNSSRLPTATCGQFQVSKSFGRPRRRPMISANQVMVGPQLEIDHPDCCWRRCARLCRHVCPQACCLEWTTLRGVVDSNQVQ